MSKTIYVDSDYCCHTTNPDGTYTAIETDIFGGKCDAYIEGYRFVPDGKTWVREDGTVFKGEMIAPWKPYSELAAYQLQYETMLAEAEAAYQEGVNEA